MPDDVFARTPAGRALHGLKGLTQEDIILALNAQAQAAGQAAGPGNFSLPDLSFLAPDPARAAATAQAVLPQIQAERAAAGQQMQIPGIREAAPAILEGGVQGLREATQGNPLNRAGESFGRVVLDPLTNENPFGSAKDFGKSVGGVVNRTGKWAVGPNIIGPDDPFISGVPGFLSGLGEGLFGTSAPAKTAEAPVPDAPLQGPVQPQEDPFQKFMNDFSKAYRMDVGTSAGVRPGIALDEGGADRAPSDAEANLKKSRSALDEHIAQLAKGSALPEPEFKARLAHVMVGIALGYSNSYGNNRSVGQSIVSGLAGGGATGLEYGKDLERRQDRVRLENLAGQRSALAAEGQLHTVDAAAVGREQSLDVERERTKVMQMASIRGAEAKLRAAAMKNASPGQQIRDAQALLELRKNFALLNSPVLDEEVTLPTGQKMKIGSMAPSMQQGYILAAQAPQAAPEIYAAAIAKANQIIETQSGGKYAMRGVGGKPEEQLQILANSLMAQHFMGVTNLLAPPEE